MKRLRTVLNSWEKAKTSCFLALRSWQLYLGVSKLLRRNLQSLSGGEQQRVAIASALAAGAKILLLDEPTSALDISATADILATLKSLASEQQLTVLLAEHRIEKLLESADSLTVIHGDGTATQGELWAAISSCFSKTSRMTPTVVELSNRCGWSPTAITVAEAQRVGRLTLRLFRQDALPNWISNAGSSAREELERFCC
jgi:energy-coupling factor transport system ATP-binding protein